MDILWKLLSSLVCFLKRVKSWMSPSFTLIVEEFENEAFINCEQYMVSKVKPRVCKLKKKFESSKIEFGLVNGEFLVEEKYDMRVNWKFLQEGDKKSFKLDFYPNDEEKRKMYLEEVLGIGEGIRELCMFYSSAEYSGGWKSVKCTHPCTFKTLAKTLSHEVMEFAKQICDELSQSNETPALTVEISGTSTIAKTNFIAAIANKMAYDVYVLQVPPEMRISTINKLLFSVKNRSILVVEDSPLFMEVHQCLDQFCFSFGVDRLVVFSSNRSTELPCPAFAERTFHLGGNRILNKNQKKKLKKKMKKQEDSSI